ncbi:putative cytoplasmic dynein heavy chain 2 [Microstroma glucosiphilum]|uniref:Dynein heavy chain, cytoplasmic n=1 Tax=Pseudomicrostroma glucosiphilum TaxID=1684307 RepID=A0A316UCG1_9BASI|nr:putative cytoplasmic dynein heavy chain 2 [Pseudomicrostroma glucosiphilum]PWN22869.1 putative cytoplasmic dynein heavy chain 2 [Pseudomicrostroma glucosiphilum]
MIHHYVQLSNEKRGGLEEEQRHLNVGLDKLKETVSAVSDLQKSLAVKRTQLTAKNSEANEKLQSMVAGQKQTEEQKQASLALQSDLERQETEISERREVVMADLADAEPAVQEAQASVSNIKKQHLTEVRSMGNPPAPVKNAMESVCIALGHKVDSWRDVQGIIRRDDFIASIVNYDTEHMMTRPVREKMKRDYLSKPGYDFETINRASKACGPLAKWVIAQVRFSEILDRVGPLRDEVESLEQQTEETKQHALHLTAMIRELELDIEQYKNEYATLISETQAIKMEMETVQKRVDRSIQLLDSLGSEKERWDMASQSFETQMSTIVGDALLCAAFLTYAGFFDQAYRGFLWAGWKEHAKQIDLKHKAEISPVDYLSNADDRLTWQQMGLPNDSLAMENVIILLRCRRTALVIDPSGQATSFLLALYKERKIVQTSFLDPTAFVKSLESALRFGSPMLVSDAEHFDPILNPVLNSEFRKTGGRVLIRLGPAEIDYNPNFHLVLATRASDQDWSPDICSRVTFCNFTTTRASLQNQCLDAVLKAERPDTDKKRTDLMKLQGEFRLRLRHLEKALLNALNESQGNILDDDKVIDTLETLKKEAAEVTAKVEETDSIIAEVEEVTNKYVPLAKACSSLFFIIDQLHLISHFYQFSLRFFLDIFEFVLLKNPRLAGVTDAAQRMAILRDDLFLHVYKRTSRALAHQDHVMLATLLAQVWAKEGDEAEAFEGEEFAFLLEGGDSVGSAPVDLGAAANDLFDVEDRRKLAAFLKLPALRGVPTHIKDHVDDWQVFRSSNNPESDMPHFYNADDEVSPLRDCILRLLIVKCFRPDRIDQAMIKLNNVAFGSDFLSESVYDLQSLVKDEVTATTPVALCSVPGFDASYRVDTLVKSMDVRCTSIAMGSQEGFTLADQAIATGARNGKWVLLKNVHLAPTWLSQLEKKLSGLNPHRDFRLFLTCETNPVIPINFLRASRILMNEPPPGLKASMLDLLRALPPSRLQRSPAEATRLFFLLAFFHSTVIERLRYTPLGWSKSFEFNDSDAEAALDTIEAWLGRVAKGRSNINPASIPWDALRSLIKEAIYGGKIDNEADQRLLDSFVDAIFTPQAYESTFHLVNDEAQPLQAPDGTRIDQFLAWTNALPEQQPPQWLALPPTAERVIATAQGVSLLSKLVRMRQLADDDGERGGEASTEESAIGSGGGTVVKAAQPAWMKALQQNATQWTAALPEHLSNLSNDGAGSISDPLYRFWAREHRTAAGLLRTVRADLREVIEVCEGSARQTNHNRKLLDGLPKGVIPSHWMQYAVPKSMSLSQWVSDFAQRLSQIEVVAKESRYERVGITLGLLFTPAAYLTATRQYVAHRTKVSLDNLQLELRLNDANAEGGFLLEGLKLEGARWSDSQLSLNDGSTATLQPSSLVWLPTGGSQNQQQRNLVPLSVYLNGDRSTSLFSTRVAAEAGLTAAKVAQRAVALRAA